MGKRTTDKKDTVREDVYTTETDTEMSQNINHRIYRQKRICYQGPEYEAYIYQRNLWVCIAIVSTGIPYIIPFLVAFVSGMNDYPSLYRSGELVLSAMALISPFIFEIFSKKSFLTAWKSYLSCVLVWIAQVMTYALIRHSNVIKALNDSDVVGVMGDLKILVLSLVIVVATFLCCIHSLHTLYLAQPESDMNEGGQI